MGNVVVSGVKGSVTMREGFQGIGYKVKAPYSGLAVECRKAREALLNQLKASKGGDESPLVFTVSPPEKITSMEDIHTLYILVDEKSFSEGVIPDGLVRFEMPPQNCIHFHYQGSMNNCTSFYSELFAQIQNEKIAFDTSGYRLEVYGKDHNWENRETTDNELDIYFPIK